MKGKKSNSEGKRQRIGINGRLDERKCNFNRMIFTY